VPEIPARHGRYPIMTAVPLDSATRLPAGDTLDVRAAREFRVGHFASAASCPLAELPASLHLLPPREAPFWVFGDENEVAAALALLRERGYEKVEAHPAVAPGAAPLAPVASPWVSGEARVRLWRPADFLAEVLEGSQAPRAPGLALDVACGTGRNACYLALGGFTAIGIDVLPDALERARSLADAAALAAEAHATAAALASDPGARPGARLSPLALVRAVSGPHWVQADAQKQWPFREGAFRLVVCFRFLWRPLFSVLAAALAPGGALVYQTFTREQARHGKPARADFLLESGELRESFERLGLRTARYREENPEGGPALASLWAVREGE